MRCMQKCNSAEQLAEYNDDNDELYRSGSQYDDPQIISAQYEQEIQKLKGNNKSLAEALAERNAQVDELEQQLADIQNRSLSGDQNVEFEPASIKHNVNLNYEGHEKMH